jgi:hypothetical protein
MILSIYLATHKGVVISMIFFSEQRHATKDWAISRTRGIVSRRDALALIGKAAVATSIRLTGCRPSAIQFRKGPDPEPRANLLDSIQRAIFRFFWEQANPATGLIKDRAATRGIDSRTLSSIASTGFGLTALCIADSREYQPTQQIKERAITTLNFLLTKAPTKNGFFYHYMDMNTGARYATSGVSSIDTAILLCGVLACRAYFNDEQITNLSLALYDRVNWQWMLNGGSTLSQGWKPEHGFYASRWDTYCELMMMYLLAMGSRTNPIAPSCWYAWARPTLNYRGLKYITSTAPIFIHQFSHAWIDFRNKRDSYADYFTNSIIATQAHKMFCLSLDRKFPDYKENLWGISASDSPHGYEVWGGPPAIGPIDGTIVPSAVGGSIPFLPEETLAVLRNLHEHFPRAWTRYGYVNAFNPLTGWYDPDVVGISLGVVELMAENYRTQFVWNTFMTNPEITKAMLLAGFHPT